MCTQRYLIRWRRRLCRSLNHPFSKLIFKMVQKCMNCVLLFSFFSYLLLYCLPPICCCYSTSKVGLSITPFIIFILTLPLHVKQTQEGGKGIIIISATELSLGGSSPYTITDKTNKNIYIYIYIYIYINETVLKHRTNNTKHSKYKYTYYQNTHTLQNKLKQPQYKIHTK